MASIFRGRQPVAGTESTWGMQKMINDMAKTTADNYRSYHPELGRTVALSSKDAPHLLKQFNVPKAIEYTPKAPFLASEPRLLLVSDSLPDYEQLIQAAAPHVTTLVVKYDKWNLSDLLHAIKHKHRLAHKPFASIAFFDFGEAGSFQLLKKVAGGQIDLKDFECPAQRKTLVAFFRAVSKMLAPNGRFDVFACDTAMSTEGKALMNLLAKETGHPWAASTDLTGTHEFIHWGSNPALAASSLLPPASLSLVVCSSPTVGRSGHDFDLEYSTAGKAGSIPDAGADYFVSNMIKNWKHHAGYDDYKDVEFTQSEQFEEGRWPWW